MQLRLRLNAMAKPIRLRRSSAYKEDDPYNSSRVHVPLNSKFCCLPDSARLELE